MPPNCHKYATFRGVFFQFFVGKKAFKNFFENNVASALKMTFKKILAFIFFGMEIFFCIHGYVLILYNNKKIFRD